MFNNRLKYSFSIHCILLILSSCVVLADEVETKEEPGGLYQPINADAPTIHTGNLPAGESLTLEEAIELALAGNPGLAEIQARAKSLSAIPSQVGTLPDPIVSFNALNLPTDTFDISQENATQLQFGISQALPFPGKLALREQAAEYEAAAAANNVDEVRLLLTRDVKIIWWRLFYLDQAINIILHNQDLLRQFVIIAETKFSVGEGLQQDVLLAQLELSKLLDLELRLGGARGIEEARLNALLDVTPDKAVQLPQQVAMELPGLVSEQVLYTRADQSRPLLAGQQNRIEAANALVDLAKKDYYPDFNLAARYGFRSGDNPGVGGSRADSSSILLSMNVPIFLERKQSKALAQRKSEWFEQNYRLHDLRNTIQADISAAVADYLRARDQFELFGKGIIPQAQQTVASMLAGYQVNKVDFLNLVRAQITLYNYEISYWQTLTEAKQSLARIRAAIGEDMIYE